MAIDIFGYFRIINSMLYVLHHPKGALLVNAQNRKQVWEWSRRQLGSGAKLVSISEMGGMDSAESVERSGTGIRAASMEGFRPFVRLSNIGPMPTKVRGGHRDRGPLARGLVGKGLKPTLH